MANKNGLGIDLGTANTLIIHNDKVVVTCKCVGQGLDGGQQKSGSNSIKDASDGNGTHCVSDRNTQAQQAKHGYKTDKSRNHLLSFNVEELKIC